MVFSMFNLSIVRIHNLPQANLFKFLWIEEEINSQIL